MTKRINFLNIPVDCLTMQETINIIDKTISEKGRINHTVINAGKVVLMQKDKELFNSVVSSDLINADGQSIVWGARLLGKSLPERVAGIDLMQNLVELAYKKKYKIFFFGAKEEVISKVVDIYSKKYSSEIIAGYRNGYYQKEEESLIAKQINDSAANILFVAISSPTKEKFLHNNKAILKDVNFTMGVGGSFDVIAEITKRAPLWMQNSGLEWFYRFLQEPQRMWKRYLITNFLFVHYLIRGLFK